MTWDRKFLGLAAHVAGWSKDPSTKTGAVVVGRDKTEVALGYNGFPPGIADTPERLNDRPLKYKLVVHAERNALDNARFDVRGGTVYVSPWPPCAECAKSIITRGIKRVVAVEPTPEQVERWGDSFKLMKLLFDEAGVELVLVSREETLP